MEAGESGGLRGTDGKLRGTSHAILSNQSHRGDRSSFRTWKPTAGATVTWEEERAGYQMEGSASKGQRIIGQERFFFSQDTTMCLQDIRCTRQGPSRLPASSREFPQITSTRWEGTSYSQLFLSYVIICSLMQIPLLFQLCIFLFYPVKIYFNKEILRISG